MRYVVIILLVIVWILFLIKSKKRNSYFKENLQEINLARNLAFEIIDEINKKFHKTAISISLKRAESLEITQSKVSGVPYIPIGGEIPMGTENRQLSLLAQINCSELPENDIYPKEGILQFWFLDEPEFGADWDDLTNQENFRVLYYKEIGRHHTEEELKNLLNPYCEYEPVFSENKQYEISFKVIESYIDYKSEYFQEEFCIRWNSRCKGKIRWINDLGKMSKNLLQEINNKIDIYETKYQIGGYPKIIQSDSKYNSEKYKSFETLLFQIDSQFDNEKNEWEFIFSDDGIYNFFIETEKLKNCDFSNIMFEMDCY